MKFDMNYENENRNFYKSYNLNKEINMKESDIMTTKSNEIKNANKERFQNGTSKLANRICFGYSQNDKGELIINPKEALTVMWIFESYLSGYSLSGISKELENAKIKSPTGKDKWSSETISRKKWLSNILIE